MSVMDPSLLPFPEIHLKVEETHIKFDDDDGEDFDEVNQPYGSEICISPDIHANLNLLENEEGDDDDDDDGGGGDDDDDDDDDGGGGGENTEKSNYYFSSTSTAKSHPVRRFQCSDCLKYFSRNDHLKNHMRTHTGERPYSCDSCQKSFAKHFDLTRHKQYVHGSVTTFFICEECGRTFSRKDHLKSHLLTHKHRSLQIPAEDDNPSQVLKSFTCETCGRTYCRLKYLKKHMEKHCENIDTTGFIPKGIINDLKDESITENIFKGINFHFMSVNDVKARVDNALRSFACEFCDRLFVRKDHLKNHERTHTGERPFQCEKCDKRFAKRFVMTRHLQNVHGVNAKMHKCPECERMFARTDHLKTHIKIHILATVRNQQRDNMHKCEVCAKEFTRSDNLKTHMKIHLLGAAVAKAKKQQEDGDTSEPQHQNSQHLQDL